MITRRYFIRASAIAAAGLGAAPSWLLRAAAQGESKRKILVAVFQRGAADGLNIAVPAPAPRENPIDLLTEVVADQFSQNIAEVRSDGQVSLRKAVRVPDLA